MRELSGDDVRFGKSMGPDGKLNLKPWTRASPRPFRAADKLTDLSRHSRASRKFSPFQVFPVFYVIYVIDGLFWTHARYAGKMGLNARSLHSFTLNGGKLRGYSEKQPQT